MKIFWRNSHKDQSPISPPPAHRLPVTALFLLVFLLSGFTLLTVLVLNGGSREMDQAILLAMRTPAGEPLGPHWAIEVGRDITALGGNAVLILLTAIVVCYLFLQRKRGIAVVVLVATLGALGVSTLLKNNIGRDRPDLVPHWTQVYTASFPSGHSMLSASTYLTLGALLARVERRRRIRVFFISVAIFITLLVGVSRVYLGVHWPTDVLGGWIMGSGWALLCWLLARWLQQRKEIED